MAKYRLDNKNKKYLILKKRIFNIYTEVYKYL